MYRRAKRIVKIITCILILICIIIGLSNGISLIQMAPSIIVFTALIMIFMNNYDQPKKMVVRLIAFVFIFVFIFTLIYELSK